ncbi:hypothetical protein J2Y55_001615 [Bosea sp. BE125]|uniref:hypothetical protein n=1 Tax=Bosea sp. BE125 TaxID=2817909 RepID=UPI00285A9E25|nr:hypothetical protein [Bosea sp. BE125]MDR6870615.1 hypothetical protein [Bosea sp. BE125]
MGYRRSVALGAIIAPLCAGPIFAQVVNSDPLYGKLISLEKMTLEAFASLSSRGLLDVHNEIMEDIANERQASSIGACSQAYTQLSITVVFHASIIQPDLNQAANTSEAHDAEWADRTWSDYRKTVADCEALLGIESPPRRPERPSSTLRRLLPILPK